MSLSLQFDKEFEHFGDGIDELNDYIYFWESIEDVTNSITYENSSLSRYDELSEEEQLNRLFIIQEHLEADFSNQTETLRLLVHLIYGNPGGCPGIYQIKLSKLIAKQMNSLDFFPVLMNSLLYHHYKSGENNGQNDQQSHFHGDYCLILNVVYFYLFHHKDSLQVTNKLLKTINPGQYPPLMSFFHCLSEGINRVWFPVRKIMRLIHLSLYMVYLNLYDGEYLGFYKDNIKLRKHEDLYLFSMHLSSLTTVKTKNPSQYKEIYNTLLDNYPNIRCDVPSDPFEFDPLVNLLKLESNVEKAGIPHTLKTKTSGNMRDKFPTLLFEYLTPNLSRFLMVFLRMLIPSCPGQGSLSKSPTIKLSIDAPMYWQLIDIFPHQIVKTDKFQDFIEMLPKLRGHFEINNVASEMSNENFIELYELEYERQCEILSQDSCGILRLLLLIFDSADMAYSTILSFLLRDFSAVKLIIKILNQDLSTFLKSQTAKLEEPISILNHLVFPPFNMSITLFDSLKSLPESLPSTPSRVPLVNLSVLESLQEENFQVADLDDDAMEKLDDEWFSQSDDDEKMNFGSIFDSTSCNSVSEESFVNVNVRVFKILTMCLDLLYKLQFPVCPSFVPNPLWYYRTLICEFLCLEGQMVVSNVLLAIDNKIMNKLGSKIIYKVLPALGKKFITHNPHCVEKLFNNYQMSLINQGFLFFEFSQRKKQDPEIENITKTILNCAYLALWKRYHFDEWYTAQMAGNIDLFNNDLTFENNSSSSILRINNTAEYTYKNDIIGLLSYRMSLESVDSR
eukprot:TRINITY_DN11990_c0_g1_i1.p1 TRINITY_DN11990_c0_g1~~TRINITY_DN11990_c0_g1_i1.p1  ORF type:complete len:790 (+),score=154.74 TRINITY_DN11990_c0_g1_i1:55-2424(+)